MQVQWFLVYKEVILLAICVIYLGVMIYRNWGKRYVFVGLDQEAIDRFSVKTMSGEAKCRQIIEELFGLPFPKTRSVKALRNPATGRNLELDCYNSTIVTPLGVGLAFEVDGAQHSTFVPHFHQNREGFEKAVKRDRLKDKLCREAGIMLIRIPYDVEDKRQFIEGRLRSLGLWHYL